MQDVRLAAGPLHGGSARESVLRVASAAAVFLVTAALACLIAVMLFAPGL